MVVFFWRNICYQRTFSKHFHGEQRSTDMSQDDLNLPNDVEQLKVLIAEREVAHNVVIAERDATIAQRETVIASQHDTIDEQLMKLAGLRQQLARLLRKQYGPQKERIDPDQLTLFSTEQLEELVKELEQGVTDSVSTDDGSCADNGDGEASSPPQKAKRKGHGRRPLPEHLPREEVFHELSDEERTCPCCGKLRKEIGDETSEELEFIPASLKVIRHHRKKYACDECEENVAIAPKPAQPIAKGLPGPGLLAHTVLSKYGDFLPLYRLEDILSRNGIIIRRSTLCGWVAAAADLLRPLYDLMCHRVRQSHVIHTDDTGIKMLAKIQCENCKFWTYVGDEANRFSVYEFSLTREGKEPLSFLEGFHGYLQADAFSGYDQVYASGNVIEVACMAHCRRYWWEARETDSRRVHEAISYIARLYALETEFDNAKLSNDDRRDARQQHSVPILSAFEAWLRSEQNTKVLPKSEIGKAFTYTLNQWTALCRYTEDGALSIDNNLAERQVKLPAIGRKNWLFVGSEAGGERAAILLSFMASAKLCGVEPWAWLNAIIRELPLRFANRDPEKPPDLTDLLPDVWLRNHPEHRWHIDDIRKVERERSRKQKIAKRRKH